MLPLASLLSYNLSLPKDHLAENAEKEQIMDLFFENMLLSESSKEDQAKAFLKDLQANNPKLFAELQQQALMAVLAVRNGYKPLEKVETLKHLFHVNPAMDPTNSGDTYGVRAFITAMTKNKKEAGKAKRFYDRTIDAFFKAIYNDSPYLPTKVPGFNPDKKQKVLKPKKTKISTVHEAVGDVKLSDVLGDD